MSDGEREEKPWPPDEALVLLGLTREEWDEMAKQIQRDELSRDDAIKKALESAVRRRANEHNEYL